MPATNCIMLSTSFIEIVVILTLIVANGILAMSEIALVTARKVRLHKFAEDGHRDARVALDIADSPNDFLSTVQIGITLIGICAGAVSGATIAKELEECLNQIDVLAPFSAAIALGLVVVVITYLSLIIGELVPKRLALQSPEKIACRVAIPMQVLSQLTRPAVAILSGSTNLILRIFGIKELQEPPLTEAELQLLVEQATAAGVFEEAEQEMMASVLRLNDRKVSSIMTPRREVLWVDDDVSEENLLELVDSSPHARFVVAEKNLDHVLGVVEAKEIMRRRLRSETIDLDKVITQPEYIPETFSVLELLERFRDTKQHLAIVLDEYGGLQGLVTREDIFEAIVGEVPALGEFPRWEAFERDDGSWLLDGQMPLDEFKKLFAVDKLPGEDTARYETLAGFVLFCMQRIPKSGERFAWQDLQVEIVDMDEHRIDKLLVSRVRS